MGLYFVMIGVQGAGKGTQAKFLIEKYGIPQISTGDLFRAMKTQDTPLAREVQALMREGKLIPDEITNRMVEERLTEPDAQQGAIFDGYPRNVAQAEVLDGLLGKKNEALTAAIVLELDSEIAFKRAEGRRYSPDKQRVYNIYFNPPQNDGVDDVTGEALIQREDDKPTAVQKRIDTFYDTTMPIIDYYQDKGLVIKINADQSIEAVRDDVMKAIEEKRNA